MKQLSRLLGLMLLLLALPLAAQSGTQTLDLGDEVQITLPASLEIDTSQDGIVVAQADGWSVIIITPASLESQGPDALTARNSVEMLTAVLEADPTSGGDASGIEKVRFGTRVAARFTGPDDGGVRTTWVVLPIGDSYGLLIFVGQADTFAANEETMMAIVESFDVAGTAPTAAASGATCTVRASSANSSQLRVGPGENRSAIAFLPASTDVSVTGRAELDDGSVWFQLDKTEAAPQGTAAAELWVNEEQVETVGDCDRVGETNAPPVIPISVAPPTTAPGEPAAPPAQAGALPASGTWTIVLNPITNASCLGYDNVQVNTADLFTPTTYVESLVVLDGGTFRIGGDVFRRVGSTNSFAGVLTFSPTSEVPIAQMRFDLQSSTAMGGELVANYNFDDLLCSHTATFTARRG